MDPVIKIMVMAGALWLVSLVARADSGLGWLVGAPDFTVESIIPD